MVAAITTGKPRARKLNILDFQNQKLPNNGLLLVKEKIRLI
jgi:hypothetical protein